MSNVTSINRETSADEVFFYFDSLSDYVSIYVPSTVDKDTPIKNDSFKEVVMKTMSGMFGGCTATEGIGSWMDDDGKLITENVTICKSYYRNMSADTAKDVVKLATWLKRSMTQACISVEYNGKLMFI